VHLSRAEFEARVNQARAVTAALKTPPRLLQARYHAVLADSALAGTAELQIVNPAAMAGMLPIQPFNLASRDARLDKAAAVLGDLDGKAFSLLVEQPGKHVLKLDWTARGESGPTGLRFRLEVPSCALTSFELELPADLELFAALDRVACLLSGPEPVAGQQRRLWRLDCPETSPVDLLIRPAAGPGQSAPLVFATLQTRQNLALDGLVSDYDLALEVLHGSIRELDCECDPGLRPISVSIRNVAVQTWELRPATATGAPAILKIKLPEAFQAKAPIVQVHCLASLAPGERWHSPGIHVAGAVPRGETLSLHLAPEVELQHWQAGNFRLQRSSAEKDGGQTLTLQSGLQDPSASQRPTAVLRMQDSETRIRQRTWWQIQPGSSTLTTQLIYEVIRGQRFRLPVSVPAGWNVERVELYPAGLLQNWSLVPSGKEASTIFVDLDTPLKKSGAARLTIELRAAKDQQPGEGESLLAFPVVAPTDQRQWEGELAIGVDSALQGTALASAHSVLPATSGMPEAPLGGAATTRAGTTSLPPFTLAAWHTQQPDFYYPFWSRPVTGTIRLQPRPPRFHAHCDSEVVLAPSRAQLHCRLTLEPMLGSIETVDLALSAPTKEPWQWKSESSRNGVRAMRRLLVVEETPRLLPLGGVSALEVANLFAVPPPQGSVWRMTLAEPLHERLVLDMTAALNDAAGTAQPVPVPVLTVLNADQMAGVMHLHVAGDQVKVEASGLREVAATGSNEEPLVVHSFRYGRGPVRLSLRGPLAAVERLNQARADQLHLSTYVEPGGGLLNQFRFQVYHWQQRMLPVQLPAGARLRGARVDGRWLARPEAMASPAGNLVALPVPGGAAPHVFEVLYEIDQPAWRLWSRLAAPVPVLPLPAERFRGTWYLPPGLAPLDEGQLQQFPGMGVMSDNQAPPNDDSAGAFSLISSFAEPAAGGWQMRQQNLVAAANSRRRKSPANPRDESLQAHLEDLAGNVFQGREPLVVDVQALQEMGLQLNAVLKRSPADDTDDMSAWPESRLLRIEGLEGTGLVCLACPAGPLLTSQRQYESWLAEGGQEVHLSESVAGAIAAAAHYGQDGSGRFRRLLDWLHGRGTEATGAGVPLYEACTAWEALGGEADQQTLLVIRPAAFAGLSWVLGLLFLVAVWKTRSWSGRACYGMLIAWLVLGSIAWLWLPVSLRGFVWAPLAPALALACLWYVWSAVRALTRTPSESSAVAASALLALGLGLCLPGQAAAPAPFNVWLLPGPPGSPNQGTVLAPADLVEQLNLLSRRGVSGFHGPVLLGADYEGMVRNGAAEFLAAFRVYCFGDEAASLFLPLSGIELQEATLDGNPAFPVALPAPLPGYRLQIKGRGHHKVQLRFSLSVTDAGAEHELRCAVPEIAQSKLHVVVPAGAAYAQIPVGRGRQRATSKPDGTVLDADLGRVSSLVVHWRQDKAPPLPVKLQVNEIYLWDLRSTTNVLHGVLQYAVSQGAPISLSVVLPPDAEISQVRTGPIPGGPAVPRLKDWRITMADKQRELRLQFQAPLTASVQVYLDLVSSKPLAAQVSLSLPTPVDAAPAATDSYLGVRVQDPSAEPIEFNRITGIQPEVFNAVWQAADTEERILVQRAYSFRRAGAGGPVLRLGLHSPRMQIMCLQNLTWHIGMRTALVQATAHLRASQEPFSLVDWAVPANVTVTSVGGAEVRSWSRNGPHIQVWLRRSLKEVVLEMSGALPQPAGKPEDLLRLPCLQVAHASPQWTAIQIRAENDVALNIAATQQLWPAPSWRPAARDRSFFTPSSDYSAVLRTTPATANAGVRVLTLAEVQKQALTFSSTVDYWQREGELQSVSLRLRNWPGASVRLEAPHVSARRERRLDASTYRWSLELQPGVSGHYTIKLSGSMPLDGAAEMLMPDVSVEGVKLEDHLLVTTGADLAVEETHGLSLLPSVTQALQPWPAWRDHVVQTGGSAWRAAGPEWLLRLQPRYSATTVKPARIIHQEFAAAVRDGRHWEHEGAYLIQHDAGAQIGIILPAGARFNRVTLDGTQVRPAPMETERFVLPLGDSGVRLLRIRWFSDDVHEALDRLNLASPRLENALGVALPIPDKFRSSAASRQGARQGESTASLWTIEIPPGYRLPAASDQSILTSVHAVERDLERADAMLDLSRELSAATTDKTTASALARAQEQFYRSCSHAQEGFSLPEGQQDGAALAARLAALKDTAVQLAKTGRFEAVRAEAERQANTAPAATTQDRGLWILPDAPEFVSGTGTPTIWLVTDNSADAQVHLVSFRGQQMQRSLAISLLIGLLGLIAWLVTYSPRLVAILQALWPEQLAVLGYIGWQTFGPHLGFVVVFLLAAAGRIICLALWASRLAAPAATSSAGNSLSSSS
jgi:hypothetical protein